MLVKQSEQMRKNEVKHGEGLADNNEAFNFLKKV